MRKSFFSQLTSLAEKDESLYFITADLGFGSVEGFREKFPDRFLNVGVSEQAMLGIAAGMSTAGKKVICYSIAPFSWLRPFEFFRNGVLAPKNPVMVVGVGPGFDYTHDGISHYCFEDLALAQSQPNLHVELTTYKSDVESALTEFANNPKPTYLRLPRNEPNTKEIKNIIESSTQDDSEILILSHGLMLDRAKYFFDEYIQMGLKTSIYTINNLSNDMITTIVDLTKNKKLLHVVEDHYKFGGLATRISENLVDHKIKVINDSVLITPVGEVGNFSFMESKVFKDKNLIINEIKEYLIDG